LKLRGDFSREFEARGEILFMRAQFERLNASALNGGRTVCQSAQHGRWFTEAAGPEGRGQTRLDNFIYTLQGDRTAHAKPLREHPRRASLGLQDTRCQRRFIERTDNVEGIMAFIDHWDKRGMRWRWTSMAS
jgi:NAD-dependent DNA ligase